MKNYFKIEIVVILFLMSMNIGYAQTPYRQILGDDFKWYVPVLQMEQCFVDTVYVVKESSWYNVYYCGQWYDQDPKLLGRMYESEDKSKLYFCDVDSSEYRLIMDLDLEVGDEFTTYNAYYQPTTLTVSSVYIEDGLKHIKFNRNIGCWSPLNYDTYNSSMMFIEGIGPNYGFGIRFESDLPPYYFICKHEGENLVYSIQNSIVRDCDFIESKIQNTSSNNFDMQITYMSEDVICLKTGGESGVISIYDINGKIVDIFPMSGNDICVNISRYISGTYFIKFENNNIVQTQKIIKI